MKSFFTSLILLIPFSSIGQDCSELFFSEYVEGVSLNMALEIYNPTPNTIDLSAYSLERYANGSATVSSSLNLSGTIEPFNVWVITNGETDSLGQFGYIFQELYDLGNQAAPPYPSPLYFNGDDAQLKLQQAILRQGVFTSFSNQASSCHGAALLNPASI